MRVLSVMVVVAAVGCSRKNPIFCEGPEDCENGVCDIARNTCVESIDGTIVTVDAAPDGRDECPAGGRIVFQTDRDGDFEIATAHADGNEFRPLTTNIYDDEAPQWSPDGSRIAWLGAPNGLSEVFVMTADGTNQVNVSRGAGNPGRSDGISWSPDGTEILFTTNRDGNDEIYRVGADGSGLANLTQNAAADHTASWSPDGSRVVFTSTRDGTQSDIYAMNRDGSSVARLTTDAGTDYDATWSPSGAKIAFIARRPTYRDLWTMNPDGSGQQLLVSGNPGAITAPEWSQDGGAISYSYYNDLWWVRSDGSGAFNLTNTPEPDPNEFALHWSPDGQRLVFSSDRTGNHEVYSIRRDGTDLQNLTNDSGDDYYGRWGPCP